MGVGGNGSSYRYADRFHGADVGITKDYASIIHENGQETKTVLIRSYGDGIRVDCTFISNEALKTIWDMHSKYLKHEDYVQHQSGY